GVSFPVRARPATGWRVRPRARGPRRGGAPAGVGGAEVSVPARARARAAGSWRTRSSRCRRGRIRSGGGRADRKVRAAPPPMRLSPARAPPAGVPTDEERDGGLRRAPYLCVLLIPPPTPRAPARSAASV